MDDLSIFEPSNLLHTQERMARYRPGGFHPVKSATRSKPAATESITSLAGAASRLSGLQRIKSKSYVFCCSVFSTSIYNLTCPL
jgi:hypothetical protein